VGEGDGGTSAPDKSHDSAWHVGSAAGSDSGSDEMGPIAAQCSAARSSDSGPAGSLSHEESMAPFGDRALAGVRSTESVTLDTEKDTEDVIDALSADRGTQEQEANAREQQPT